MSHEIRTPKITDLLTGRLLFGAPDALWDGSVEWLDGGNLWLILRHYAEGGRTQLRVLLKRDTDTFRFDLPNAVDEPVHQLPKRLLKGFRDAMKIMNPKDANSWYRKHRQWFW